MPLMKPGWGGPLRRDPHRRHGRHPRVRRGQEPPPPLLPPSSLRCEQRRPLLCRLPRARALHRSAGAFCGRWTRLRRAQVCTAVAAVGRRGERPSQGRARRVQRRGPAAHDADSVATMRSSPLDDASSSASSIAPRPPLSDDACDPGERFAMPKGSCRGLHRDFVQCKT